MNDTAPADRIDAGGNTISADSIRARMSAEHQKAIDAKLAEWFADEQDTHDSEGLLKLHH